MALPVLRPCLRFAALAWLVVAPPAHAAMAVSETGLRVHVGGEVRRPGLQTLAPGARVAEAIAAAGGPTPRARLEALNLAARVHDGDHLRVPAPGEAGPRPPQPVRVAARRASRASRRGTKASPTSRLDLNRAGVAELERLPGVGPAMASRIVQVRQRLGGFQELEDLREVPGIGAKRLARLRPHLTL